eukprot:Nitzschia sp. Nitz4//scaffold466_size5842//986//4399//NITZ4_009198-RA/size5842-processed-gene-0.7-mRNA-1//-1//CDS//3329552510//4192//frame0
MEDEYRITYDSQGDGAFVVHLPTKDVKFTKSENGLYYFVPEHLDTGTPSATSHVQTVEENKRFYTERQVQRANKARELYHALGTPSTSDFKAILRTNMIKNNPVTLDDVNAAERIYGPDIGALKGKSVRTRPNPVVADYIEVPKQLYEDQRDITLAIDTMKINGIPFLATISHNILYRTVEWMPSQTMQAYREVLAHVFRIYSAAKFRIRYIHCDQEYKPLLDQLEDIYHIKMNYANAQEHVPEAERNIRVIKERFRATFHRLPYLCWPTIMVKILAMESAKKLNYFPPRGGISEFYRPRMILHHEALDYHKHCLIPFGTYVQALHEHTPNKNTQHPRTLDGIYLRYVPNQQGGHEILDLHTGRRITRRTVTPVPITPGVVDLVNAMGAKDKAPAGLRITTKTGHVLYDHALLAGVSTDPDLLEKDPEADDDYEPDEESFEPTDEEASHQFDQEYDRIDPTEIVDILEEADVQSHQSSQSAPDDSEPEGLDPDPEAEFQYPEEEIIFETDDDDDDDETQSEENIENENEEPTYHVTRSGRTSRPPSRYSLLQKAETKPLEVVEYSRDSAKVIALTIGELNSAVENPSHKHYAFAQTYSIRSGVRKFGDAGKQAVVNEIKQLHDRTVFKPIDANHLTPLELKRAMSTITILTQKRDGRIKSRTCVDGSSQRPYVAKEDAASPTVATESLFITAVIDANEHRDIMTADIPNAFVQTMVPETKDGERIIMKITGILVDYLLEIDSQLYAPFVITQGNSKVLYVELIRALYGMLQSSLWFYKQLRHDLEQIGFEVNPYDPCVANRMINGKQHTVTWHVDDLKSSHVDPKVNDKFAEWLENKYGDPNIGKVQQVRGKRHDYLAMHLDYNIPGAIQIDMAYYVKAMLEEFPFDLKGMKGTYPWSEDLFKVNETSTPLQNYEREIFHTFVAKSLFLCKRARPDILPAVAFLSTRVRSPDIDDWQKLRKMLAFLNRTVEDVLTLQKDGPGTLQWYIDASYAVHNDYRSHTGAILTMGKGAIHSISSKQKINTRSSTEAELVAVDDMLSRAQWTKQFIEAQGYKVGASIFHRDNESSMKLEANGKASSGKRTRHFHIKYFYVTDLINRGEIILKYCPTDEMNADYMTKPLLGVKFNQFRQAIMNLQ